ncbi:MAG: BamA/TamA family outer membrane protein [Gloeobacteraceae cyanobacterium ES-bin-316]|nr:BamA/TamA family outer membrane protein [Ferruginibacter sp.]
MRNKSFIWILIVMLLASSCSIRKHLPKDTYLYNGPVVNVKKTADNPQKTKPVKKELSKITFPKKNKMILGYAYKVGFWYGIGTSQRPKSFRNWLRNRLGEEPVLSSTVDFEANAENMTAYLENRGYFQSTVAGKSSIKGYKMKALYDVLLTRPYVIDTVKWILDSSVLSKDILAVRRKNIYIIPKQQFDLANIKAETKRIDLVLKRKGYYYFSPDNVKAFVDTSTGDHKANIFLSIKKDAPLLARTPQTINTITIFPNYTLLNPPPDTSRRGLLEYKGVFIRDTVKDFKPGALVRSLTYDTGSLYNQQKHNESLNRFINMGSFKFVKSRYEPSSDSVNPSLMNVYYYLTPFKKKTISAEIGGFSKSNSFTGAQLNVNWKNRNLFRGAEQLGVKAYGAFEVSLNDSLKQNNNWRVGSEVSLTIPRLIAPFKLSRNNFFPPYTKFTLGYEWMRRQLLYTKNFLRLQYDLTWKKRVNIEQTLSPVSITYNNATAFSPEYLEKVNVYPVLQYANKPELILASFYNFTNFTRSTFAPNIFFIKGNVELAGNIAGLLSKPDSAFDKQIGGAYFAQFAKLDADFRYTRKLTKTVSLVNRVGIGVGLPYGNSAYLPFSRQFIIGGSNSLRGFPPRQLGPGRVITTPDQQVSYPQIGGDYKLELQTELRFPLISKLNGALFLEGGNIWTKSELLYGPGSKLTKQFMKDMAVDGGLGVRFDITFLIIRLDVAIPFRKPWLPMGSEWVFKDIDFGSGAWRKENLIFNLGIGYPF